MKSVKKYILIVFGSLFLALGMIGIFIPVLPTTPFLLLASFCYLKSSKRLYKWLMNHRVFGGYIYTYFSCKSVLLRTKIVAIILLWASLILSMVLVDNLHVRILLVLIGIAVSIHLLLLKTIGKQELQELLRSRNR